MKKANLILILFCSIVINGMSQTVTIGKQVWMTKNLDVDRFRNGDPIPEAKTSEEWKKAGENKQPAWCYYDNATKNGKKYGKLYNWYAVSDPRGLAPEGWHVPSDDEWSNLINYLDPNANGGKTANNAGDKMKSMDWKSKECLDHKTNSTGFSGLPGGYRLNEGIFEYIGKEAIWWSSTIDSGKESIPPRDICACNYNTFDGFPHYTGFYRVIYSCYGEVWRGDSYGNSVGFSVRCLKD